MSLKKELEKLLNQKCRENVSDTPDFILAEYMMDCLRAYEKATNTRQDMTGNPAKVEPPRNTRQLKHSLHQHRKHL